MVPQYSRSTNFWVHKNSGSKKCLDQKCLGKTKFWSKIVLIHGLQKSCPKRWVEIGLVTTEISLIWTNVVREMSAWQLASVKDGPRNLKFGKHRVSNSWDIADIEIVVVLLRSGGWVGGRMGGCLNLKIRLSQPQLKLKLSWVELRLSLAKLRFFFWT